jgi:putative addiction module killer protein
MAEGKDIEVEFYVTRAGKVPFKSWISKLRDAKARARINVKIVRLRVGNFGDSKSVGKGVSELRVDYGPGYRVYFARTEARLVLLLIGGDKSTQKEDIATAQALWAEYKSRSGEEPED